VRHRLAYMAHASLLYDELDAMENLRYFAELYGLRDLGACEHSLRKVGLDPTLRRRVGQYSQGMRQRLSLARALLHQPELLVLDEPLAGLDPAGIDAIGEVLIDQARNGHCVLFSSHQLDQVEDFCESVTIIDHGRLVVTGRVDDLATQGQRRLVVRVEGDRDGAWARSVPGVGVSEVTGGAARLVLDASVNSDDVLNAARKAGRVTEFVFERRRMSEVFREAMA